MPHAPQLADVGVLKEDCGDERGLLDELHGARIPWRNGSIIVACSSETAERI